MNCPTRSWLLASLALSAFSQVGPVSAAPNYETIPISYRDVSGDWENAKRADLVPLRILPLGASIMTGVGSSTGDGHRKPLRDALRQDGYEVNMVGSRASGQMKDQNHEGRPGDVLTQIQDRVANFIGYKPNIVIINGGTNDGNGDIDISNVGDRMNNILNALWNATDMSDMCIMLSTLIPTTNANGAKNRAAINSQYRSLVTARSNEGKCIYLADMDLANEKVWFDFNTDYSAGESPAVHPNNKGHRKMAAAFYQAIHKALDDNRVKAAPDFDTGDGKTGCDKFAGNGIDAGGLTQRGSGYDDGIYYHNSDDMGILWSAESDWDRGQWKFARLFDTKYDDLLAWLSTGDSSQEYVVWANSGDGKAGFKQINNLTPDINCKSATGVNFIDMNGDGFDDLVYIDEDGNAYLSINQGDGDRAAGKAPTFKRVSDTAKIKTTEGYGREKVRLADIDGDGRGDYGVWDGSSWKFWRNGGVGNIPEYWQALGARRKDQGYGSYEGYIFEDVNGDGRDDSIWLDSVGAGYMQTNGRSCATGSEGDGLNVAWRDGYFTGASSGTVYKGMGSFVTDSEKTLRNRLHFGRIYGQSSVFGNFPKQDYIFMQHEALSTGKHRFQMRVWKNTGSGGTKLLADGNKYCNMMGHSNGMQDYVWAYAGGTMEMWANRGKTSISDSDTDGFWESKGTIWTPPSEMNRRDLHLQDWDGDGNCDIIYADPESGKVQVWINNFPSTGKWDWTHLSNPAPSLSCSQKRGLGIHDLAVRFADLTGNKRADYLCIEPNSRVTGFVQNDDGSFEDAGQIKVSISKDRANLRWADVNGDGKDDLLWVEKFSGDAYVWYNEGRGKSEDLLGSTFSWRQQTEVAYKGNAAGTCEYWPDLDGNGRADEHYITGTFDNKARTSFNPSCGLTDFTGDDATFAEKLTEELAEYNA
ncbi:hypothetical protein V2G26_004226 [Clonostachys chloroleuca]